MLTKVNSVLAHPLNRFCRAQPMTPTVEAGGARVSAIWARAKARLTVSSVMALTLHQLDARVVPVHEQAGDEGDRQIHGHGDGDDLDRLAGLVQRGSREYREQIGIADADRERGILREVEVLAGQRRDDHPQRPPDDPPPPRP